MNKSKQYEDKFAEWAKGKPEYENIFTEYAKELCMHGRHTAKNGIYLNEGILGSPLAAFASSLMGLKMPW